MPSGLRISATPVLVWIAQPDNRTQPMPRRPRMYLPGYTYHLVQRGNNRQACFYETENYRVYLGYLRKLLPRYENHLHAYCLMTNHIHLLVTQTRQNGISRMMQSLGSSYGRYMNKKYERTGSLWEGRHKSSIVGTETYLFRCYRYIELNPVAARIVINPEEYEWSSVMENAWATRFSLVSPHACYQSLGSNPSKRRTRYRQILAERMSAQHRKEVELALQQNMPLGDEVYIKELENRLGRKLGKYRSGRPPKQ